MEGDDDLQLFREYRRGGDRSLRNELVERHMSLADYYVRRYSGRGVQRDDLRQLSLLAIIAAVERFDPDLGVTFGTFASRTIEGECKRYLRDRTWIVRPPRRAQETHLLLRRLEEELTHERGRPPTLAELSRAAGVPVEDLLEAMEAGAAQQAASIDSPGRDAERGSDSDGALAEPEWGFLDVDQRMVVHDLLEGLPERERQIIELRFYRNMTQPEIAEIFGVSQSYLSRVIRRILAGLRARLEAAESESGDGAPPSSARGGRRS